MRHNVRAPNFLRHSVYYRALTKMTEQLCF